MSGGKFRRKDVREEMLNRLLIKWDQPAYAGGVQHSPGLSGDVGGPERTAVLGHLPLGPEQDGDAGAVHEGDAGQVQLQTGGGPYCNGFAELGHHVPGAVVVDLPGQGDGEAVVPAGDGDGNGLSPLL